MQPFETRRHSACLPQLQYSFALFSPPTACMLGIHCITCQCRDLRSSLHTCVLSRKKKEDWRLTTSHATILLRIFDQCIINIMKDVFGTSKENRNKDNGDHIDISRPLLKRLPPSKDDLAVVYCIYGVHICTWNCSQKRRNLSTTDPNVLGRERPQCMQ